MECQNTIKNLKINKNKTVGTVVIVVEGEEDEFRLLKHIFTKILNYNYVSMKRNKTMQHEFVSKNNKNTIIVANTKSSSIKTVIDDKEYKDKLYTLLKHDYNKSLKNVNIYIIWDRDKEEPKKDTGDSSFEKKMLRSVIIAVSHIIYLNDCFKNNLQDNASDSIR